MALHRDQDNYGSIRPYYDDPNVVAAVDSRQFSQRCDEVSTHIFTISNNASGLERALKQVGTSQDSLRLRQKIHGTQQTTNAIITQCHELLKNLAMVARQSDKSKRLQVERLRNELKDTIKRYSLIQKKTAEKMRETMPTKRPLLAPPASEEQLIGWGADDEEETARLVEDQRRRQQLQIQKEHVDFEIALYEERDERIRQIEADILDVNEIFRELASLVHEQGEVVDTIEANVEKAATEVEEGATQLQRASKYQKSYRKKLCCLVVILSIVGVIITIIVVLSVKK
ncbi:PREDICTED: syntaxin-12-like [Priapulus caudatus]|uniref:Syntaxin-12-like n=1 Tax=Priapulus caudatus TaxID=37621 RepID=A0ABM1ECK7_PRICU|nr:PREDICTED: syntaxin-12-like [Priapulus caudatus]XP_014669929.1 PREDICTED: syntaxin-12-like [Priapulus caudatus]